MDGPFTVEQHVADAVAMLDARDAGRVVVVGHSWGVHLALQLALAHPERVAGLVLIDGPGVTGDGGIAEMGEVLVGRLLPGSLQRLQEVAGRMAAGVPTGADAPEQTALLWPGYFAEPTAAPPAPPEMRVSVAAHAGAMSSMLEHLTAGFAESLGAICVPVIFILGAQSPMAVSQGEGRGADPVSPGRSDSGRWAPSVGRAPRLRRRRARQYPGPDGQPGGSVGKRRRPGPRAGPGEPCSVPARRGAGT